MLDKILNYNLRQSIKIFNICHDNIFETHRFIKQFRSLKAFFVNQAWQKNMLYSNKILCVSPDAKRQFESCFASHKHYDEKKLAVMPFSVLPAFLEQSPEYKKREDALVIGNIFDERKRPLDAVEIINKMKQIKKLYIYGSSRCFRAVLERDFGQFLASAALSSF
jgi:hypothetical protein